MRKEIKPKKVYLSKIYYYDFDEKDLDISYNDWDEAIVLIEKFKGKTFKEIKIIEEHDKIQLTNQAILFITDKNEQYLMTHKQSCCEEVFLEKIDNDLDILIDSVILNASERIVEEKLEYGSETSSFYHITSLKGTVVLRWCGSSNGYYSETVNILKIPIEYQ